MRKYFQASEFKCKCGRAECPAPRVSDALLERLDRLRAAVGYALYISSGVRCVDYNKQVGGEENSAHVLGLAADILADSGKQKFTLVQFAIPQGFRRIGVGKNFIHLDVSQQHPQDVIWQYGSR